MSKILIVDDALFMRKVIRDLLIEHNYTDLIEAGSGKEAVEMFNEHRPDLIIMDITMPAFDGIETIKVIRKIEEEVTILMCSAMGQESMVKEALKLGAKDFIVKPFKQERMMQAIKKLLGD
ncbi:MAG: response regulator [Eubacteriales bacterium]